MHLTDIMGAVPDKKRIVRGLWIVAALCVLVWAQGVSLAAQHEHHNDTEHCCGLCHLGPLPLVAPETGLAGAPIAPMAWVSPANDTRPLREALPASTPSRAPPRSQTV
jgi:hypothetical protein